MKAMIELKDLLEEEIYKIVRKGDITPTELERLDDAVDIIKDIETICAMKEYNYQQEEPMYSGRYPYYMRDGGRSSYNSYEDGRRMSGENPRMNNYMMDPYYYGNENGSYNRGNSYGMGAEGRSYEQGGNSRGYSGHMNKEDLKKDLQEELKKATTDKERIAIQQLLDQWKDI